MSGRGEKRPASQSPQQGDGDRDNLPSLTRLIPTTRVPVNKPMLFDEAKFKRGVVFGAFPNYTYEVGNDHKIATHLTQMVDKITLISDYRVDAVGTYNEFHNIDNNSARRFINSVNEMVDTYRVNVTNVDRFELGLRMSKTTLESDVTKDMNEANLTLWAAANELHPRVFACAVVYDRPVYLVERCTALKGWLRCKRTKPNIESFNASLENIMGLAATNGLLMADIKPANIVVDMDGGNARFIDLDPKFTARIDVNGDNGGNGVVSCIKFINSLLLLNFVARWTLRSHILRDQTTQMFQPLLKYVNQTMQDVTEINTSDLCMRISDIMFEDVPDESDLNGLMGNIQPIEQANRIMSTARRYSELQKIPESMQALKRFVANINNLFNPPER
jgi:hypothetical protein